MQQRTGTEWAALLGRRVLEQIVASSSEAVVLLDARDPDKSVVYANPAYEALSGQRTDDLVGRPWPLLERDSVAAPELERLRIAVDRGERCDVSLTDVRGEGATWSGEVSLLPLHAASGDVEYLLCQHRPVARSEAPRGRVARLEPASGPTRRRAASPERTDPITGLLRYEHFMTLLARDLGVARREGYAVSLLGFEIVELDVYRRTFGEKAATSCVRMIGAQVAGAFRRVSDSCARCDESTIVAAVIGQDAEQASMLAERVAAKVRRLGLHNPRALSARQLWVRHAVAAAVPETDDATAAVERLKAGLAAWARQASNH